MKRIAILGLLVLSLFLLQAGGPSFAQQGAQKQAPPPCPKALPKDAHVQKLWEIQGYPKEPQIAVLQLSGDEFREFDRDQKQYLNDYCIFPRTVVRTVSRVDLDHEAYKKKAEAGKDDPCVVTIVQGHYCAATISSCFGR